MSPPGVTHSCPSRFSALPPMLNAKGPMPPAGPHLLNSLVINRSVIIVLFVGAKKKCFLSRKLYLQGINLESHKKLLASSLFEPQPHFRLPSQLQSHFGWLP